MTDLINNGIILLAAAALIIAFVRKNLRLTAVLAAVFYACLPVAKWNGFSIIPAYFITVILGVMCACLRFGGSRRPFGRTLVKYTVFMCAATAFCVLGFLIYSDGSFISAGASFCGMLQYCFGAVFLSYIYRAAYKGGEPLKKDIFLICEIITAVNALFAAFQLIFFKEALSVTMQLYVNSTRTGPVNDIISRGQFMRAFGCNYSPIFLGLEMLIICAAVLGDALCTRQLKARRCVLFFAAALTGLTALSKTAIMGVVLLLIIFAVFLIFVCGKRYFLKGLSLFAAFTVITAAAFGAEYLIGMANKTTWLVEHYYSQLESPLTALESRYDGIIPGEDDTDIIENSKWTKPSSDEKNKEPSDVSTLGEQPKSSDAEGSPDAVLETPPEIDYYSHGITFHAYMVFKAHPVTGVGPLAIEGEFIGDSQYVVVLHDGGLLAFACYLIFFLSLFVLSVRRKEYVSSMILLALGMGGLSIPSLYSALTIPFTAFCLTGFGRAEHIRQKKDEKMLIAEVLPEIGTGGAEKLVHGLCREFYSAGCDVKLIFLYGDKSTVKDYSFFGDIPPENIYFLNKKRGFDISLVFKLSSLFAKLCPDVIHSHLYAGVYSGLSGLLSGTSAVMLHTVHNEAKKELPALHRFIMKGFYNNGEVVPVAISQIISDGIKKEYGIKGVPVILNGTDTRSVAKKESYGSDFSASAICVARFYPQKNHALLLKAFAIAHERIGGLTLTLAGSGELEPQLKKLANELSISNSVIFAGTLCNLNERLRDYDLFILTSDYEGLPVSVLEAMAAGLPVVCTDVGGVKEAVKNGENGILIEPGDISAAEGALVTLASSALLREKYGRAAAESAKRFDIKNTAENYRKLFDDLQNGAL